MARATAFAVLLLTALLAAAPARAVDPKMFNEVAAQIRVDNPDKFDERAVLAALLARPDVAAEFEADGKAALSDPHLKELMVAKWRGKAAAYAAVQAHRGGIDYSRSYQNWKEVLGPEGYAYVRQRLLTMSKANSDKLIQYLGLLDQKLAENNHKVDDGFFSIANKIVNGILDEYRKDLGEYLGSPAGQQARAGGPAAATQLAQAIQQKQEADRLAAAKPATPPAAPPTQVAETKPAQKPATKPDHPTHKPDHPAAKPATEPAKTPAAPPAKPEEHPGNVAVTNPAGGALDQARNAARAGEGGGTVFDGGGRTGNPTGGSAVVVPPGSGGSVSAPNGLTPSAGPSGQKPSVVGSVPDPMSLDDLDARVAQAQKSGDKPYSGKIKKIAVIGGAVLGGLLGGLIGFLVGGPIGAAIGAAAGAGVLGGAGYLLAKRF